MHGGGTNLDIEGLRAYAVAITMVAHLADLDPIWAPFVSYFWLGGGVDLFFCVSGFVITSSFARNSHLNSKQGRWRDFAAAFWIRRFFRLWPAALFWGSITVLMAVSLNGSGAFGPPPDIFFTWLASLFQLVNAHLSACAWFHVYECRPNALWHYWSLSLEEQFYVVFPFAVWFLRKRTVLLVSLVLIALQLFQTRPWASPSWFFRTDALLLGVVIALVRGSRAFSLTKLRPLEIKGVRLGIALGLMMLLVVLAHPQIASFYMGLTAMVAAALVFVASFDRGYIVFSPALRTFAGYVGSRSYSIYLVHMPVYALVREIAWRIGSVPSQLHHAGLLVSAVALTLLLAEFSFRVIEEPLRAVGRRISSTGSFAPAPAPHC